MIFSDLDMSQTLICISGRCNENKVVYEVNVVIAHSADDWTDVNGHNLKNVMYSWSLIIWYCFHIFASEYTWCISNNGFFLKFVTWPMHFCLISVANTSSGLQWHYVWRYPGSLHAVQCCYLEWVYVTWLRFLTKGHWYNIGLFKRARKGLKSLGRIHVTDITLVLLHPQNHCDIWL